MGVQTEGEIGGGCRPARQAEPRETAYFCRSAPRATP